MMKRLLRSIGLLAPTTAVVVVSAQVTVSFPPSPGFPSCSICGVTGTVVMNHDRLVQLSSTPSSSPVTCGYLELAGQLGFLSPDICGAMVVELADTCGCVAAINGDGNNAQLATIAPVTTSPITSAPIAPIRPTQPPTSITPTTLFPTTKQPITPIPTSLAPVTRTPTSVPTTIPPVPIMTPPNPGFLPCSICGPGSIITIPDAVVLLEGGDGGAEVTCKFLQDGGFNGFIDPFLCPTIPPLVIDVCGCAAPKDEVIPPSRAPVSPAPITNAPVAPTPPPVPTFTTRTPSFAPTTAVPTSLTPTTPQPVPTTFSPSAPFTRPPNPNFPACSICGGNALITKPDGFVTLTGSDTPILCGFLEEGGRDGFLDPFICPTLPTLVTVPCGCAAPLEITPMPSAIPSDTPSLLPSISPSSVPSLQPSDIPSTIPSVVPTTTPTVAPSWVPSDTPSGMPSAMPSLSPSAAPTLVPSFLPTWTPTLTPTGNPSSTPTVLPSSTPTLVPTGNPSSTPSVTPTLTPTLIPTVTPTLVPTVTPTLAPTATPTLVPTGNPSSKPSVTPTLTPTATPTSSPTRRPTANPTYGKGKKKNKKKRSKSRKRHIRKLDELSKSEQLDEFQVKSMTLEYETSMYEETKKRKNKEKVAKVTKGESSIRPELLVDGDKYRDTLDLYGFERQRRRLR